MYDPDRYREKAEIERWKDHDPIAALTASLLADGVLAEPDLARIEAAIAAEVDDAVSYAEAGTLEDLSDLGRYVVSEPGRSGETP